MTGAWDDPAVRAAVAATNRVRDPLDVEDQIMAAAGVAAATAAMAMADRQRADAAARRERFPTQMAVECNALVANLVQRGVPQALVRDALAQAWHLGWTTGFYDADNPPGRVTPSPF